MYRDIYKGYRVFTVKKKEKEETKFIVQIPRYNWEHVVLQLYREKAYYIKHCTN